MKNRRDMILVFTLNITVIYLLLIWKVNNNSKCLSFEELVSEEASMDDNCLIQQIRKTRLFAPSKLPYNLTTRTYHLNSNYTTFDAIQSFSKDMDAPWVEALIAVEMFVPKGVQRLFFECGALDGVTFSTTLHMERFLNWTGVLIEPDDRFYSDMRLVHRKAYGVHACASRKKYPSLVNFKPSPIYIPANVDGINITIVNPGIGQIPNDLKRDEIKAKTDLVWVHCVPVYSILLAVNMTRIDLFILDVEGVEIDILETIPYDKVQIAVFMIEVYGKQEKEIKRIHELMNSRGYTFYDRFEGGMHPGDDIFIKQEYLKNPENWKKIKRSNVKDIYKIITGKEEKDISKSDIENFLKLSFRMWGTQVDQ